MCQHHISLKQLALMCVLFSTSACNLQPTEIDRSGAVGDAFKVKPEEILDQDVQPECEIQAEACNELDDDCDGLIDEGFSLGSVCETGYGECLVFGEVVCVLEENAEHPERVVGQSFCQVDPSSVIDPIELESGLECDGLDNDCDQFIDEHFVSSLVECGEGACSASALTACQDGSIVSGCREGEALGSDETCDGLDDDCDGRLDESFIPRSISCGLGQCTSRGVMTCHHGEELIQCTPHDSLGDDQDCDGLDDDCDGLIDEGFIPTEFVCGRGACLAQGHRFCENGRQVSDCAPGLPDLEDLCDGLDNDCDGRLDEDYGFEVSSCGLGQCLNEGVILCNGEGNLIDTCQPLPATNADANCDGLDNDCDGMIDEDFIIIPTTCGVGSCLIQGILRCVNGRTVDDCTPLSPVALSDTTCDGLDEDCDGRTDESFLGAAVSCGGGSCYAEGNEICIEGEILSTCVEGEPATHDRTCNGIDDDCDGFADEDYVSIQTFCGVGRCAAVGQSLCSLGVEFNGCTPLNLPELDDTCDSIDDDCDGRIDEHYVITPSSCGLGQCERSGIVTCQNGEVSDSCIAPLSNNLDNQCDQLDNDCDGLIDEDFVVIETSCGLGQCTRSGSILCVSSGEINTCSPLDPPVNAHDQACDGVDSDCDGIADEDYQARSVQCGVGACTRNGQTECQNGSIVVLCEAGQPISIDDNCNQNDDDCDGLIDEGYVPVSVSCMVGACTQEGQEICTSNGIVNTCSVNLLPDDTSCDGIDDDCDGQIDEDYIPPMTMETCGLGVCTQAGSVICENGSAAVSCTPSMFSGPDDNCNGVDEDCDGENDEAFTLNETCGIGSCQVTSSYQCIDSQIVSNCIPRAPQIHDICGNNSDDNCDGLVTDYRLGTPCEIEYGFCTNVGITVCNPELTGTICSGTKPVPRAEICDQIDNDCDGFIDERLNCRQ